MKRLFAFAMLAGGIGVMPCSLSAQDTLLCSGIELMQPDLIVTCDDEVLLQSSIGPLLWNQDQFSDSLLVSSSGLVEVQEAALNLSFVDLGEEFGYINLGDGFNNLTFPLTIVSRFSIPEGYDGFLLFATDEGLGYSGVSLSLNQSQGWFETFIGDGYGGGPGQRRSKKSYCSLSTDTWYTVVAVIRGATDHTVYLDGVELGGDYSGSGNGQIVDLGRPATMGYSVPDSGPLYGQELSYTMKFDFFGVYDFELQPSDIVNPGSCDSDSSSAFARPSGAVGWYDFGVDEPFVDSEGNQPPIQAVGDIQTDVAYCLCPGIEQVEVQLLDCEYAEFFCGEGTAWDVASQTCIVANPSDSNFDGCVQLNDLLDLLSAYGDCGAEESAWQCGDPLEYQGYDYTTVQIGEQCWFAENLQSTSYDNGDLISTDLSDSEWVSTNVGAMTVYGEGESMCNEISPDGEACDEAWSLPEFGRLYNWFAVNDARGLCPSGWHIPTDGEWMTMEMALGMSEAEAIEAGEFRGTDQGDQMKTGFGWYGNGFGTNSSGFSGLPCGFRFNGDGGFYNAGYGGTWWSSSPYGNHAYVRYLGWSSDGVYRTSEAPNEGLSVRCIQDFE